MIEDRWKIRLFGGLSAQSGSTTITRFRTQKTGLLLAWLAHNAGSNGHSADRAWPREQLVELCWPDSDPEAARTNLRVSLNSLRKQLEPPHVAPGTVLVADRLHVRLNPAAIETDTRAFEELTRRASTAPGEAKADLLRQAVELVGGEFLSGFYEEWAQAERTRLAAAYAGALRGLVEVLFSTGDTEAAVGYARRWVAHDLLNEEAHRALIRLNIAAGRPAEARSQYDDLRRLLREEIGMRPSPETEALVQGLGGGGRGGSRPRSVARPQTGTDAAPALIHAQPARSGRLPAPLTEFFGRGPEMAALGALLKSSARLITLTGPGGAGKTRLAVEAARAMTAGTAMTSGVAGDSAALFVPLAAVEEPARIAEAIQEAAGFPLPSQGTALDAVAAWLERTPTLLVLDNFEQLAESGAGVALELLERVPSLRCLVTSRHLLGLPGEQAFPVAPLPVPSMDAGPREVADSPSGALFVNRVRALVPDFQVTPRNAESIARLCAELEGMPLALELAAGLSLVMTPAQMVSGLKDRLGLLVDRRGRTIERHRSMRGAIEWSFRLLPEELREALARVSVFRGGFTMAAAGEVCGIADPASALSGLRSRSLLEARVGGEEARFQTLAVIREFAAEQLDPDTAGTVAARHIAFYRRLVRAAAPGLEGPEQDRWLHQVEAEQDNIRRALEWALENAPEEALALVAGMGRFWDMRGLWREGRGFLQRALCLPGCPADSPDRAAALSAAGTLAWRQSDMGAARSLHEQALEGARRTGDRRAEAQALHSLGVIAQSTARYDDAWALNQASLAIRREIGDQAGVSSTLNNLACLAEEMGRLEEADALLRQCVELRRATGDKRGLCTALMNAAGVALQFNQPEKARACYEEGVFLARAIKDAHGLANALKGIGRLEQQAGRMDAARRLYTESLELFEETGEPYGIAAVHLALGDLCRDLGDPARGHEHYAVCLGLYEAQAQRVDQAVTLERIAGISCDVGSFERAGRLFGAADRVRRDMGVPVPADRRAVHERDVDRARAALEDRFEETWAAGAAMEMADAVRIAMHPDPRYGKPAGPKVRSLEGKR